MGDAQGARQLRVVDIDREPVYFTPVENEREKALYEKRIEVMQAFLNPLRLRDGILIHKGLGGLVKEAMGDHEVCRSQVYKLWSLLCKFGLHQLSLRTRLDRSGAPGVSRPCDPGGRKKPGAKTREQIAAKHYGIDLPSKQPAMSTEWQLKIRAADDAIDTPIKPQMRTRYNLIVQSGFIQKYMQVDGKLVAVEPKEGEIPTYPQVKRFLTVDTGNAAHAASQRPKIFPLFPEAP